MNTHTFEEWLSGESKIKAVVENFDPIQWDKVRNHQKKIYFNRIEQTYKALSRDFYFALA